MTGELVRSQSMDYMTVGVWDLASDMVKTGNFLVRSLLKRESIDRHSSFNQSFDACYIVGICIVAPLMFRNFLCHS